MLTSKAKLRFGFVVVALLAVTFALAAAPTHDTPILNATDNPYNSTDANLTIYNQSTADGDGDPVKNIINWKVNDASITALNMPFEGGSNSTWTKDYSGNGNNGTVTNATFNSTGGYDGLGAYEFDGSNDYINLGNTFDQTRRSSDLYCGMV